MTCGPLGSAGPLWLTALCGSTPLAMAFKALCWQMLPSRALPQRGQGLPEVLALPALAAHCFCPPLAFG